MCVCVFAQSCPTLCEHMTVARKTPLSMEFSRQEYWRGLPFASPGDLPHSGIEPGYIALQADFYPLRLTVKFSHFHLSLWLDLFIKLHHWVVRLSTISSNIGFILIDFLLPWSLVFWLKARVSKLQSHSFQSLVCRMKSRLLSFLFLTIKSNEGNSTQFTISNTASLEFDVLVKARL